MEFTEAKPAKNMNESINITKAQIKKNLEELNPKIQQLEDQSVDFSLKVDKKLQEFGTKIATSKFGLSVSKRFKKMTKWDSNNRTASMEGQIEENNAQAFSGQGTAIGSSTGETDPAFDDQNLTGNAKARGSEISVPPVYDEANNDEKKEVNDEKKTEERT